MLVDNKKIYYGLVAVLAVSTVLFFQNCTQVAFQTDGSSLSSALPLADNGASNVDVGGSGGGSGSGGGGNGSGGSADPGYSETCDDYAVQGFSSKKSCQEDGEWHLVPPTDAAEIERHMYAGADFKVIIPSQSLYSNGSRLSTVMAGNEECQQFYRSSSGARPFYCLTTARFQGEYAGETSHGSARYGTDGSIYCNGMNNPGRNGCTVDPMTFKWYIRY